MRNSSIQDLLSIYHNFLINFSDILFHLKLSYKHINVYDSSRTRVLTTVQQKQHCFEIVFFVDQYKHFFCLLFTGTINIYKTCHSFEDNSSILNKSCGLLT